MIIHALKNAMIPFVTMAAIQFGYMIGIQVTIEYIFAVPGMGSAVLNAVVNRDFPVIQGFTLVIAAFFLFANIMADLILRPARSPHPVLRWRWPHPPAPYRITSSLALAARQFPRHRARHGRAWSASALICLAAALAPWIAPYDPVQIKL